MLSALVTQLATTLLSSRSRSNYVADSLKTTCNYVVGSCDGTCNYVTLFSSRSSSNYVVGFCSTTCNYVVFFSIKFKLYTLLTFVTQLATTLWSSFLSYWYYWPCCIKELHSQQFVLPKPRFTVARKILAMEVHKPQCHFAAADDWSIKTHLLTKQCCFSDSTKTIRWKWAFTVVKRENAQILVSPQCHTHFLKTRAFTNMVSGPAGNLCFWPSKQQTH